MRSFTPNNPTRFNPSSIVEKYESTAYITIPPRVLYLRVVIQIRKTCFRYLKINRLFSSFSFISNIYTLTIKCYGKNFQFQEIYRKVFFGVFFPLILTTVKISMKKFLCDKKKFLNKCLDSENNFSSWPFVKVSGAARHQVSETKISIY